MKRSLLSLLCLSALAVYGAEATSLKLIKTIPLPEVKGRIDHLAIDVKGKRLFVAALGNNSVQALDLNAGTNRRSIARCSNPQGLVYLPKPNLLIAANAGTGIARVSPRSRCTPLC